MSKATILRINRKRSRNQIKSRQIQRRNWR